MIEKIPLISSKALAIPLFQNIINFGIESFDKTSSLIDGIESDSVEWDKVSFLINDISYLKFLAFLTGLSELEVALFLGDFGDDGQFKDEILPKLQALTTISAPGDLRFHALSLYVIVRALKPKLMVETGVAHGKSSAFILLAMEHNNHGRLVSVDLPPNGNLADGSLTAMADHEVGWLVPDFLRHRWSLNLEDSHSFLNREITLGNFEKVDIFLHDSLHTYDHTIGEFRIIESSMNPSKCVFLADNLDMESGYAFSDFLKTKKIVGVAYRDFGGALMNGLKPL